MLRKFMFLNKKERTVEFGLSPDPQDTETWQQNILKCKLCYLWRIDFLTNFISLMHSDKCLQKMLSMFHNR